MPTRSHVIPSQRSTMDARVCRTPALTSAFIPTHSEAMATRAFTPAHSGPPLSPSMRSPPVSRSYAYRKVTKPLLERRRRARISKCLDDLKALMVGPMRISEESLNRLEKADILEMVVQHLHNLQSTSGPNRYQEGFNECAAEACYFLEKSSDFNENLGERLVEHLETCTGPLSIEVPRFRLAFSPPVSPVSLGACSQPFIHQTTLKELGTATPGLLMEAKRKRSPSFQHSESVTKLSKKICLSPYTNISSSTNLTRSEVRIPLSECHEQDSMWRPW